MYSTNNGSPFCYTLLWHYPNSTLSSFGCTSKSLLNSFAVELDTTEVPIPSTSLMFPGSSSSTPVRRTLVLSSSTGVAASTSKKTTQLAAVSTLTISVPLSQGSTPLPLSSDTGTGGSSASSLPAIDHTLHTVHDLSGAALAFGILNLIASLLLFCYLCLGCRRKGNQGSVPSGGEVGPPTVVILDSSGPSLPATEPPFELSSRSLPRTPSPPGSPTLRPSPITSTTTSFPRTPSSLKGGIIRGIQSSPSTSTTEGSRPPMPPPSVLK